MVVVVVVGIFEADHTADCTTTPTKHHFACQGSRIPRVLYVITDPFLPASNEPSQFCYALSQITSYSNNFRHLPRIYRAKLFARQAGKHLSLPHHLINSCVCGSHHLHFSSIFPLGSAGLPMRTTMGWHCVSFHHAVV